MATIVEGTRIEALPGGELGTAQGVPGAGGSFPVQWDAPLTDAPDSGMTDELVSAEGVAWRVA